MISITKFQFKSKSVRTVLIENEVWFVGKDVCDVLEISNKGDAFSRLKEYEKKDLPYDMVIGITDNQAITRLLAISESGLYRLVLTSRKPQAEPFQDWVCQEVLPSIRKTGKYEVERKDFKLPKTKIEALEQLLESEKRKELLEAQLKQDLPKVKYAEAVESSETALEFIEYAKVVNWGRNKLMKKLRELKILMKNSTLPYQKYIDAGYFECSQEIANNGKLIPFALITGKGQIWLNQKLLKQSHVNQSS